MPVGKGDEYMEEYRDYFCSNFERELVVEICNHENLGYGCAILYEMILSHKNINDRDKCYPSYNILSKELNMSKSTINKYINKLKEYGYLIIEAGNSKNPNRYYFPKSCMNATNYSKQDIKELFGTDVLDKYDHEDKTPF